MSQDRSDPSASLVVLGSQNPLEGCDGTLNVIFGMAKDLDGIGTVLGSSADGAIVLLLDLLDNEVCF